MIQEDTIKLLRECDAGVEMGVSAIDEVLDYVRSELLRRSLVDCKIKHEQLSNEINTLLCQYGDQGKEPCPVAKGMSWIKTNVCLVMKESDQTIAGLITDGHQISQPLPEPVCGGRGKGQGHCQAAHCPGGGAAPGHAALSLKYPRNRRAATLSDFVFS